MNFEKGRRSLRLPGYDYSQAGAYFVTVCAQSRECHFGEVVNGRVILTNVGELVNEYWLEIPRHFDDMRLDAHVVMPNHIHGIITITDSAKVVGVQNFEPLRHRYQKIIPKSISSAIRAFKAAVTGWCHENSALNFGWQRNFYDRVIRSEAELNRIRMYIAQNPFLWDEDIENPGLENRLTGSEEYYEGVYGCGR